MKLAILDLILQPTILMTLFDGGGCCQFNSPPWFQVALQLTTSDDIELCLCLDYHSQDEDVLLYLGDTYVK